MRVYERTCYMFINKETFWDEARQYCWRLGGEMLLVKNQAVMDFIKSVLNSKELDWKKNGVWNGASDLRQRGWEWTTGEKLSYQYWAPGEPSKLLGILSVENCCCMRRNDNWRWHDYHCHMDIYQYNFICQFAAKNQISNSIQSKPAAPLQIEQDDKVTVTIMIVIASVLLVVIVLVLYILYRKQKHLKAEQHRIVRFNIVDSSACISPPDSGMLQPVSNMYFNPMDIIRDANPVVYDELNYNKDSNLDVSSLLETTQLMCTGGAASAKDLDMPGYLSPRATCETSSAPSADLQFAPYSADENYVEMNGMVNLGYKNGTSVATVADGDNKCASATGSVSSLEPIGIYISPVQSDVDLSINASKCLNNGNCKQEMHIYANKMDSCDNLCNRPLPPVPRNA